MVVLEAAACGVPTIGTAVGVVPELVPSAEGVPVGQSDALATTLRGALADPSRLHRMGSTAREMAETRFGLQTSVDRFRRLYGRLTA
jgi:glycosyltransferase involved in cell wall biosynthesis